MTRPHRELHLFSCYFTSVCNFRAGWGNTCSLKQWNPKWEPLLCPARLREAVWSTSQWRHTDGLLYMPVLERHYTILQAAEKQRCCLQANLMKSSLTAPSGLCGCVQTALDPRSLLHFVAPVGRHKCSSLIFWILSAWSRMKRSNQWESLKAWRSFRPEYVHMTTPCKSSKYSGSAQHKDLGTSSWERLRTAGSPPQQFAAPAQG